MVNSNVCSILICGGVYGENMYQLSWNGKMPGVQGYGALRLSRRRAGGHLSHAVRDMPRLGRLPSLPGHRTKVEMFEG